MSSEILYAVTDESRDRGPQMSTMLSSKSLAGKKGRIIPVRRVMMGEPTETVDLTDLDRLQVCDSL